MVANKTTTPLPAALIGEATGVLLVISATEDVAKRIESHLRNAGHPLRAAWINDLEDLDDVLRRNPPDLVLYDEAISTPPLNKVVSLCAELRPDLPVIILSTEHSVEDTVAALAAGAQDLVVYSDLLHLRHLELVIVREFGKHHNLRSLRLTQERLTVFESRYQQLTENTADSVAHLSGRHRRQHQSGLRPSARVRRPGRAGWPTADRSGRKRPAEQDQGTPARGSEGQAQRRAAGTGAGRQPRQGPCHRSDDSGNG